VGNRLITPYVKILIKILYSLSQGPSTATAHLGWWYIALRPESVILPRLCLDDERKLKERKYEERLLKEIK
jgi:hypothetical protein